MSTTNPGSDGARAASVEARLEAAGSPLLSPLRELGRAVGAARSAMRRLVGAEDPPRGRPPLALDVIAAASPRLPEARRMAVAKRLSRRLGSDVAPPARARAWPALRREAKTRGRSAGQVRREVRVTAATETAGGAWESVGRGGPLSELPVGAESDEALACALAPDFQAASLCDLLGAEAREGEIPGGDSPQARERRERALWHRARAFAEVETGHEPDGDVEPLVDPPDDAVVLAVLERVLRSERERACLRLIVHHGATPAEARRAAGLSRDDWRALQRRAQPLLRNYP